MRIFIYSTLLFVLATGRCLAETIKIALPAEGNPPYSFSNTTTPQGIYVDIFNALCALTNDTPEYVYLSSKRIRSMFIDNEIDIECCPQPQWRQGENDVSVYTDVAFQSEDLLIFPTQSAYISTTDFSIKGKTVATISGYGYAFENEFERVDVSSELVIMKMLDKRRIDVGIVDKWIAHYLKNKHQLSVDFGHVYEKAERRIRLHKNKKHLLPKFNKALTLLKKGGQLTQIFQRYGINQVNKI